MTRSHVLTLLSCHRYYTSQKARVLVLVLALALALALPLALVLALPYARPFRVCYFQFSVFEIWDFFLFFPVDDRGVGGCCCGCRCGLG